MNKKAESKQNTITLSDAAREARNAYRRKWAKENPDKIKAATRKYWERKAREMEALEG